MCIKISQVQDFKFEQLVQLLMNNYVPYSVVVYVRAIYVSTTNISVQCWYFEGYISLPLHHCITTFSKMLSKSEKTYPL